MGQGPLEGVKVLEFASIGPGPFCAMMLSDMGAEVIRIDRPSGVGGTGPNAVLQSTADLCAHDGIRAN